MSHPVFANQSAHLPPLLSTEAGSGADVHGQNLDNAEFAPSPPGMSLMRRAVEAGRRQSPPFLSRLSAREQRTLSGNTPMLTSVSVVHASLRITIRFLPR